ncbi:TPA: hypothetical protein OX050_002061 [Legionella pneumophila]|uniref:XRE family transcriptional regulator n=1 Tax=Legionella pneumophila TaxID=446 RepID=A0A378K9I9_LEGPN|nr:hypothetical protein [Legionella pneumophila]ABQ55409.1 hypothetical protein conserved within Legionellae [Legionella pneumophila str. Corby]ADG25338.1 hypothetical protein lpa_02887 [Legionella pneumophila 2300/99 Alcoy]MCO1452249.1 hypothetical protein [Legionella pneumophila]MCW8402890.1 hypothetical protein [Legionella pneumophila]MCW8433502.1 hypothetical protein [Legionella pneumophila]
MTNKILTERLNNELDELGVPCLMTERVQVCSKLFNLPKFKMEALLNGVIAIDANSIQKIADELEVNKDWLLGCIKKKTKH